MTSPLPKRPPVLDLNHLKILCCYDLVIVCSDSNRQYRLATTQVSFCGLDEPTQALLLEQGYAPPLTCDRHGSFVCPVPLHNPTATPILNAKRGLPLHH
ncbi:hypothetical protein PN441_17690 [Spirulina major CS-329]|uniref:hypothetical protein n=1 Tax=Spirulina sp. TaxID=1157 RepID=UPI003F70184F|nr:hypothetical protein [Spirulina subsalsa CS-330]MDB9504915.1 hypothetical protein [Spirulina major CS-329]